MDIFVLDIYIVVYSCSTALLTGAVSVFLSNRHNPDGSGASYSHRWINAKTGEMLRPATEKQAYEDIHGKGAWEKKIEREKRAIINIGLVLSICITFFAATILIQSINFALIIGSVPIIVSGIINIIAYVFFTRYDWSDLSEPWVRIEHSPGLLHPRVDHKISLKNYLFIVFIIFMPLSAISLQIFFWLRAVRGYPANTIYFIGSCTFFLGLLYMVYRQIRRVGKDSTTRTKRSPRESGRPLGKAEAVTMLIGLLKTQTTPESKNFLVKKLSDLTGMNLGDNPSDWEKWWKNSEPSK
jgi:hypothetical protein